MLIFRSTIYSWDFVLEKYAIYKKGKKNTSSHTFYVKKVQKEAQTEQCKKMRIHAAKLNKLWWKVRLAKMSHTLLKCPKGIPKLFKIVPKYLKSIPKASHAKKCLKIVSKFLKMQKRREIANKCPKMQKKGRINVQNCPKIWLIELQVYLHLWLFM